MVREQLLKAIAKFDDEGYTPGSQDLYSFHFNGRWYPAAWIVREAVGVNGNQQHPEGQIAKVLPYTRFKKVRIQKGKPCPLTPAEKLEEIAVLAERIRELAHSAAE